MVAGTGGFCTELIKNTNGKLIGKLGSDGVYCVAIKHLLMKSSIY
ncbi:asparaginase [Bacillus spizizenii]|nr:asparaginase [Bacillus spizizenii]MCY7864773.1 asparaginase [Bacillus spizizenii]MEC1526485.1 asparaginase [Bacillus spizizenii]MEC2184086.1 asparaginase [Bacillus spizizenii]